MTTIMVYGWYHLSMFAIFLACERNTCRMQQVLDGGAKVGVIGIKVVSTLGGKCLLLPMCRTCGLL